MLPTNDKTPGRIAETVSSFLEGFTEFAVETVIDGVIELLAKLLEGMFSA